MSPVVTQAKSPGSVRIPVGGIVQSAKLIKKLVPVYPSLARQARIQGTVKFTAIIGKDGTIQNLTLVSGHPLLVQNAQDAVKQCPLADRPSLGLSRQRVFPEIVA